MITLMIKARPIFTHGKRNKKLMCCIIFFPIIYINQNQNIRARASNKLIRYPYVLLVLLVLFVLLVVVVAIQTVHAEVLTLHE